MRTLQLAVLSLLLAASMSFAQVRGGGGGFRGAVHGGGGSFRGGFSGGTRYYGGGNRGYVGGRYYGGYRSYGIGFGYGYGYPVYYGPSYYDPYYDPYYYDPYYYAPPVVYRRPVVVAPSVGVGVVIGGGWRHFGR